MLRIPDKFYKMKYKICFKVTITKTWHWCGQIAGTENAETDPQVHGYLVIIKFSKERRANSLNNVKAVNNHLKRNNKLDFYLFYSYKVIIY